MQNCTWYVIEVRIVEYFWIVKHRYSEFYELHEKLVKDYGIEKRLLPPKKLVGNQSDSFLRKRKQDLEVYLWTITTHFGARLPPPLKAFLQFDLYEIHGLTDTLAKDLFLRGANILQSEQRFCMTPLEIFSTIQRLQLAEPTFDPKDAGKDLSHLVDFLSQLHHLKIIGHDRAIGSSNIVVNTLPADLRLLKSLLSLELCNCDLSKMYGLENVRKHVKSLAVHRSAKHLKDITLIDVSIGQWTGVANESVLVPLWMSLISADFSHNDIAVIDESIKLMPKLEALNLSHNRLHDLDNLHLLSHLVTFEASGNGFTVLDNLHTKLGNIKVLNLADNKIDNLAGFSRLYSLACLDLTHNEISQISDVQHLSSLPCLESLVLLGNPITLVVDYRTRTLELFGDRIEEIILDWVVSSEKELDTARVLWSIHKARNKQHQSTDTYCAATVSRSVLISDEGGSGISVPDSISHSAADSTSRNSSSGKDSEIVSDEGHVRSVDKFRDDMERLRVEQGEAWLMTLDRLHHPSPILHTDHQSGKLAG